MKDAKGPNARLLSLPLVFLAVACACGVSEDPAAEPLSTRLDELLAARQSALASAGARGVFSFEESRQLRGIWTPAGVGPSRGFVEINGVGDALYLWSQGVASAPIARTTAGLAAITGTGVVPITPRGALLEVAGTALARAHIEPAEPPSAPTGEWVSWIGHYRLVADGRERLAILHERGGVPALQVDDTLLAMGVWIDGSIVLEPNPVGLELARVESNGPGDARVLVLDQTRWTRVPVGAEEGEVFRIQPTEPIARLRQAALAAEPPVQPSGLRDPELVDLTGIEPGVLLDIRYAGTDNFMGAAFYRQPQAFLQRPAALALAQAHGELAVHGLGLLVHDGYRPWHVTRMFWDATPDELREFVADPEQGSRHNRGSAVDLTLFDLDTGSPVRMPGGYDEFSVRSYPHYPGGTSRERWFRDLLRQTMEAAGFAVYDAEWWHFDHQDWREYPVLDLTFEELGLLGADGTLER